MPAITHIARKTPESRHNFLWVLLSLTAVLVFLFHDSFSPPQVLFNNDAPLGALSVQEEYASGQFTGAWYNVNWVGSRGISALPNVSSIFYLAAGAVGFSKFYPPFCFLLLGLSVWWFFRRIGLGPAACALGALAAALNMNSFSNGCWGLPTRALSMATTFCALGFVSRTEGKFGWLNLLLGGAALGIGLMEAYDVGAIYSLYVAGYLLFLTCFRDTSIPLAKRAVQGIGSVAMVATFAALVAAHALSTLIATQIKGVSAGGTSAESRQQKWDSATAWSLPKIETLRVLIPGLYGYRMDTPDGGQYWGRVGQQPGWEQHRMGFVRHSGSGEYAGILVVLVAFWALFEASRGSGTIYSPLERKMVRFWAITAAVSLLLAFGRHAPFYKILYSIPWLSFIRNPIKFMHPFHVAMVIMFGYGVQALVRRYLETKPAGHGARSDFWSWWAAAKPFEKKLITGLLLTIGGVVLAGLVYYSSRGELQAHLTQFNFTPDQASEIAKFSFSEVGWFIFFLTLTVALFILLVKGAFAGARARWGVLLLGLVLAVDLCRANAPWIIYYNYKEKYASNPILELLRKRPFENRVTAQFAPFSGRYLVNDNNSPVLALSSEWLQHQFPYHKIQSLDIVQSPRTPEMDSSFLSAFNPAKGVGVYSRLWELTNTRFILGMTGFLDLLNQQFDPAARRFRVALPFEIAPRPNVTQVKRVEDLMAVAAPNGRYCLFEFAGALPRAALYTQWTVMTNLPASLLELTSTNFNPQAQVLVNVPLSAAPNQTTNANPGQVVIQSYKPKEVVLQAEVSQPSVLLLNDRFDENWRVTVDGTAQPLLRCNYIMRGVFLPPGPHTVTFRFSPPVRSLFISMGALAATFAIWLFLAFTQRSRPSA